MTKGKVSFFHPASLVCTFFGVGKIRPAPGTWGSLVGVLLFVLFPVYAMLALVPLFFIGAAAANHYGQISGKSDASEIVIDEVVGQWVTIILGFWLVAKFQLNPQLSELCSVCWVLKFVAWFVLFRFFDIVKKGPVGWCDRNIKGGFGVMFDDVVAGVLAGCTSALIFWLLTLI